MMATDDTMQKRSQGDICNDAAHVENADNGESLKQDALLVIAQDTKFAGFTRLEALKYFRWPVFICIIANLACLNDGYQNQLPGSLISNQGFINQFGKADNEGTTSLIASAVSLWGAMMPVGQIPGSVLAGWINDRFGRRGGMYTLTVCYIVGTILEMTAKTSAHWAGAKFIFGIGQGLTTATVPVYVGEIAPPQIRGTLLCLYGFFFAIGQLCASVVLYAIQNRRPLDWRLAIYTEWAFHGLWILCALIWLPESPWYYSRRGQDEKALKSLNRIYKGVKDFDPHHELNTIKHELERQRAASSVKTAWAELFKGTNRIRTFGAALAISTQMLSGSVIIFNYTTYFVQQAGIGEPFLASMIVTIVLLVGLIVSFFAVEFMGRRTLIIGDCVTQQGLAGYAASFAGVAWALVSEASTARLKSKTAAFSTLTYDVALLVFVLAVPYMLASSGPGARDWGTKSLFMFTITVGLSTIGNYFLCPETKGRTQGELDEMYERKIPPRKFSQYISDLERAGGK